MAAVPWLKRLATALEEVAGESIRKRVMQGSEGVSSGSSPGKKARWIQGMLAELEELLDAGQQIQVMTRCSCPYPGKEIAYLKGVYRNTGDIDTVIDALQKKRVERIQKKTGSSGELVRKARTEPFYRDPVREGKKVHHVVCPNHLIAYLNETDPQKKQAHYCHCGWIRYGKREVSPAYCYCGAGFYKFLWESILSEPVAVEVQGSVFHGDDCCRIAVHLP